MKLTWFGGTTLRIHIGGRILVADPAGISGVDAEELVSGADRVFVTDIDLPRFDPLHWQPRRPAALIDDSAPQEVLVHSLAEGATLVDAIGEPPLLLLEAPLARAGRWARDAVVVTYSAMGAGAVLEALQPRLIALASSESEVEATFVALRDRLNGTALVALEPGMALEV